jgi:hypothetical protein
MADGVDGHEVAPVCANCGKEESKMLCKGCRLVKYCGKDCQIAHRPTHRKQCKRRAAELHEEALFEPPPKADDCPICFLPIPELLSGKRYMGCCGKVICSGCVFADMKENCRQICPFCRAKAPKTNADMIQRINKRLEVKDPHAFYNMGAMYFKGEVVAQDKSKGLEYHLRAAELGSADA